MSRGRSMRPVIFKGGKNHGKVEGIRGLFREANGRWYVRKSIKGIDKQKTVVFESENPCFSTLERVAEKALKGLTREIESLVAVAVQDGAIDDERTELEKCQDACRKWVERTYTLERFSRDTVSRRRREADGFAFVPKSYLRSDRSVEELDDHNMRLAQAKFDAYMEKGSEVAAVDCVRIIKAMFAAAMDEGKHYGINPGAILCKTHRKRKDRPDERWVTMEQSAMIQAIIPTWCAEHRIDECTCTEMCAFYYLLTLGMRPSSAILFSSADLQVGIEGGRETFRYRVNNHKAKEFMPVSQLLHPYFGAILKDMPTFSKKDVQKKSYETIFSRSEDYLCDKLNLILAEKLGAPRVKSLRKGFVTETQKAARESHAFNSMDAKRLTHLLGDIADHHYNCDKQAGSDAVMEWWNREWYARYQHYASLPENRKAQAKSGNTESRATRNDFEDLGDII